MECIFEQKFSTDGRGRGRRYELCLGNVNVLDRLEEELHNGVFVLLSITLHLLDVAHGLLVERLVVVRRRRAVLLLVLPVVSLPLGLVGGDLLGSLSLSLLALGVLLYNLTSNVSVCGSFPLIGPPASLTPPSFKHHPRLPLMMKAQRAKRRME